jgi:hypothetical protein
MREKPGFPALSRVSWEAWQNAGVRGCLGRDRTLTFPIVFRPVKSLKEFRLESLLFMPGDFSAFSQSIWEPGDYP